VKGASNTFTVTNSLINITSTTVVIEGNLALNSANINLDGNSSISVGGCVTITGNTKITLDTSKLKSDFKKLDLIKSPKGCISIDNEAIFSADAQTGICPKFDKSNTLVSFISICDLGSGNVFQILWIFSMLLLFLI